MCLPALRLNKCKSLCNLSAVCAICRGDFEVRTQEHLLTLRPRARSRSLRSTTSQLFRMRARSCSRKSEISFSTPLSWAMSLSATRCQMAELTKSSSPCPFTIPPTISYLLHCINPFSIPERRRFAATDALIFCSTVCLSHNQLFLFQFPRQFALTPSLTQSFALTSETVSHELGDGYGRNETLPSDPTARYPSLFQDLQNTGAAHAKLIGYFSDGEITGAHAPTCTRSERAF